MCGRHFFKLNRLLKGHIFNEIYSLSKFSKPLTKFQLPQRKLSTNLPDSGTLEHQEVLDVYKEKLRQSLEIEDEDEEIYDRFHGLNMTRGIFGVFDIEDLVETLHKQNAENLFVASVSKDLKYVDYIVVVSGKSPRHMQAIASFVRRVYKEKRHPSDRLPKLEGEASKDWIALDLGNIALHVFSKEARITYDLDSLWSVGPKYDDECNKEEPVSSMLEKHSFYLGDLKPAS